MATEQIAVRIPEPLLSDLDALVKTGAYESRAAAVRAGIEAIMKLEHQRQTDRAVVDGYTRQPPTETEDHAALASLREAILDEPWWRLQTADKSGGVNSKALVDAPSSSW
jgi:Arc/MetJ-type ribon-helix-helix transcriptional regulator